MGISRDISKACLNAATQERFWKKVKFSPGDCWFWTAALSRGYGSFAIGSQRDGTRRKMLAHRYSYEVSIGPIPDGLILDHLCRTPNCVHPLHVEPTTYKINLDGNWLRHSLLAAAKKRAQTHCNRGHEFDTQNTYHVPKRANGRRCKECARQRRRIREGRTPANLQFSTEE